MRVLQSAQFGIALVLVAFTACSVAEQKAEKKWDVKVSTSGEPKVWVSKSDGSKQCEKSPNALTPSSAAAALKKAGVMVYQGRSGYDGMMRAAVCGAATGKTVELEIGRRDLETALNQGYKTMTQQN